MTEAGSFNRSDVSSKVVLGVDDAPENLKLLGAAVRAGGYNFLSAPGGSECLSLLTRIEPRLILLDIMIPDMDGFETCRHIRARPALRHTPVVFLTARKTADDVKSCLAVGGNDFIVKPFDVAKLLERVRHWTARRIAA
ncbi:MAG: response regulator [Proteobacteria bacterium]|nr:response regulator [Pseudomonadota bacterium]